MKIFCVSSQELLYLSGKRVYICEMLFSITFYTFWNISQRRIQELRNPGTSKVELFVTLVNDFQLSAVNCHKENRNG